MLLEPIALLLALLGTIALAVAFVPVLRRRPVPVPIPTTEVEDSEAFGRFSEAVTNAAGLLDALVVMQAELGPRALRLLLDRHTVATSMEVRREFLQMVRPLYVSHNPMPDDLEEVMERIEAGRAGELADRRLQGLLDEVRLTSPAQLATLERLSQLFAIKVRVPKMGALLQRLGNWQPTSPGSETDASFAPLADFLADVRTELQRSLPGPATKDKKPRDAAIRRSLRVLEDAAGRYAAAVPALAAGSPAGALTTLLLMRLHRKLAGFLRRSTGESHQPATLAEWLDADFEGSPAGHPKRRFSPGYAGVAFGLYLLAVAVWLGGGPWRLNLRRAIENTVLVQTSSASGTGFIVGPEHWIITNHHVIQSHDRVQLVIKHRGKPSEPPLTLPARVAGVDQENDIAVLSLDHLAFLPDLPSGLEMAHGTDFESGDEIHVIGHPLGLSDNYSRGVVSRVEGTYAFLDVNIDHGNSGGPVLDDRGRVIAITTAKITPKTDGPSGSFRLGLAISSALAWDLIERLGKAPPNRERQPGRE